MANREIFSKLIKSNVKLSTRYDAEGREVQVERREDSDATIKEQETFDILIKAGYYRACIKGLSAFDKVVGGMTWCIECMCDYDIDIDLLFHENLTIGQKIALVEKIVAVLPQMKCPYHIEPHQIQGLEFLCIHPVIQWLVKKSVENREERNLRLKKFAVGQFHNHYQYKSDKKNLEKMRIASNYIKRIQQIYTPIRHYQCKDFSIEDEKTRVQMTLLEYDGTLANHVSEENSANDENISSSQEEDQNRFSQKLDTTLRTALKKHYREFQQEMQIDAKELTEQNQLAALETVKSALQRKVERNQADLQDLLQSLQEQEKLAEKDVAQQKKLEAQIEEYKNVEAGVKTELVSEVQTLLTQHDDLKKEESEFKEHCRKDLAELQQQIEELEAFTCQSPEEREAAIFAEKERIRTLKLQLAKRNRGIVAIQRQLDNIPDRTELAQYQRRFHELYNEMSVKHLETKQYYTFYNTLNDKKRYMEKELSLLNSICEAYNEGMMSSHGREEFIKQFETIVHGVKQTETKVRAKYNEEKRRRDMLTEELQGLIELQRQYATAVKQLTRECQRCEQLQQHLKSIRKK
ncbi:coiled-coil domain-containing protein 93 isoform X2 [Glossina fuscipes]|uniref:Coiled-coil domain-containing protein 93 n=1 Tax=Glossina fuscipes TaxID=7396 RepID=A0A9C6DX84_9MUSC|nr:coiled-coil domain-containing protein 93 isoform X2 [Glossina fuscipes]